METKQNPRREITYHVGWKRGRMVIHNSDGTDSPQQQYRPGPFESEAGWRKWLRAWVWRQAPEIPPGALRAAAFALPGILFVLFIWMVYWLSIFS